MTALPAEAWRDPIMQQASARSHYRTDLEFHNWSHGLETAEESRSNALICLENDIDVDPDVAYASGLHHDDNFWQVPQVDHAFRSKEVYSAYLGANIQDCLGMPKETIDEFKDAIYSTERGIACKTILAKCVRRADLKNVSSPNSLDFLNATYRLYRESKRLKDEKPVSLARPDRLIKDLIRFGGISYEVLSTYYEEDLSLGDFDHNADGSCEFNKLGTQNMRLLLPEKLSVILPKKLGEVVNYQPVGL